MLRLTICYRNGIFCSPLIQTHLSTYCLRNILIPLKLTLELPFSWSTGLCAIAGVSVFANMLVTNFWMSTANMFTGMGGMVQTVQTR